MCTNSKILELSFISKNIIETHLEYIAYLISRNSDYQDEDCIIQKLNDSIQEIISNILNENTFLLMLLEPDQIIDFNIEKYCFEKINYDKCNSQKLTIKNSSKKIIRILRIFEIIIKIIKEGYYINKREVYYKDVKLFENQNSVDSIIKELCFNFQIPRKSLNIISASKGLIAGSISFNEGEIYYNLNHFQFMNKGKVLSEFPELLTNIQTSAKFVLILEKETIFYKLLSSNLFEIFGEIILITGKGYPDYATKNFLKRFSLEFPLIPMLYLGDCDPYGLDILLNYAFSNEYQTFEYNNLPQIHYLGPFLEEICEFINSDRLLILSEQDNDKIKEMKTKKYFEKIYKIEIFLNEIQEYQINRWKNWFKKILDFEILQKKMELDCFEELTNINLLEYILKKITVGNWN